jgi:hypothetical protein
VRLEANALNLEKDLLEKNVARLQSSVAEPQPNAFVS